MKWNDLRLEIERSNNDGRCTTAMNDHLVKSLSCRHAVKLRLLLLLLLLKIQFSSAVAVPRTLSDKRIGRTDGARMWFSARTMARRRRRNGRLSSSCCAAFYHSPISTGWRPSSLCVSMRHSLFLLGRLTRRCCGPALHTGGRWPVFQHFLLVIMRL